LTRPDHTRHNPTRPDPVVERSEDSSYVWL